MWHLCGVAVLCGGIVGQSDSRVWPGDGRALVVVSGAASGPAAPVFVSAPATSTPAPSLPLVSAAASASPLSRSAPPS